VDDIPPQLPNPKEKSWDQRSRRLWIQMDNQQVAQIFSGLSKLHNQYMEPLAIRVSRRLLDLLYRGWRPRMDTQPSIEWDRREFNSLADHSANVALDTQADWNVTPDKALLERMLASEDAHIRICSDGARRGDSTSAVGLAFISYDREGHQTVLLRAGKLIGDLESAFTAEMIALEWCLDTFFDYLI
jgi:hypothetical protein